MGIGLLAGLLGGLLGVGGGFVMVPLQVLWARVAPLSAAANSLIAVISISLVGGLLYYFGPAGRPQVDLRFALLLGGGGIAGAFLGARWAKRIPERLLLSAVAILLAGIGVRELLVP